MGLLKDSVYFLVLKAISLYKWVEYQILSVFSDLIVQPLFIHFSEDLGIVYQLPGEPEKELSKDEEKRICEKSGYKSICTIKINNTRAFARIANQETLGAIETYMDGDWEPVGGDEAMSEMACRVMDKNVQKYYYDWYPVNKLIQYLEFRAFNLQTVGKAFEIAEKHYDLGNDLFESFLDPWMQYTCGYWAKADNLNDAQLHKMELIAKKLDLKPGMRVLDVGCGWGTLCKYLAENYGVRCVGITVSKEGVKYAEEKCKGLTTTEFRVQDYRDVNEKFDRIVSVGMFEHVGSHNFRTYFEVMERCLKDDGIYLLHTIGMNHSNLPTVIGCSHKYIFPNGQFPYYLELMKGTEGLFIMEDWHNFSQDYEKTLVAWRENFRQNWPKIEDQYGKRFYRMWTFYLSFAASIFKSRKGQLWQIVLSKDGLRREYRAAR